MVEIRKKVDSRENTGEEGQSPRPGTGQEQQAGALSSAATRGHWFPLLEL